MELECWTEMTIEHFTQGQPGQVIHKDVNAYEHDLEVFGTHNPSTGNIWALFQSKVDWSIAKWAKLRGPSSTAISELLSIEGVCFDIRAFSLFPYFIVDRCLILWDCLTRM